VWTNGQEHGVRIDNERYKCQTRKEGGGVVLQYKESVDFLMSSYMEKSLELGIGKRLSMNTGSLRPSYHSLSPAPPFFFSGSTTSPLFSPLFDGLYHFKCGPSS